MPAAVLGIGGGVALTVMVVKDRTYVPSAPYAPQREPNQEVAVVYYSRSGHSEAAAREIARIQCAHRPDRCRLPPRLFGPVEGRLRCEGARPSSDPGRAPRCQCGAPLVPRVAHLDVPPGDAALGLRRAGWPTAKQVVLFTTGNSRFKQVEIDAFAQRVEAQGGRLIRYVFVRRGRIYWQKSREECADAIAQLRSFPSAVTCRALRKLVRRDWVRRRCANRLGRPKDLPSWNFANLGWSPQSSTV